MYNHFILVYTVERCFLCNFVKCSFLVNSCLLLFLSTCELWKCSFRHRVTPRKPLCIRRSSSWSQLVAMPSWCWCAVGLPTPWGSLSPSPSPATSSPVYRHPWCLILPSLATAPRATTSCRCLACSTWGWWLCPSSQSSRISPSPAPSLEAKPLMPRR